MKKLLFIIAILFTAILTHAQENTFYMCMDAGTVLNYQSYDTEKNELSDLTVVTISRTENRGGDIYVISNEKTYDKNGKLISENKSKTTYYSNGVTYFVEDMPEMLADDFFADIPEESRKKISVTPMTIDIDGRWPVGKKPKNRSMDIKVKGITFSMVFANRKYHGKEWVKTAAGEFECMKMTADVKMKAGIIGMKAGTQRDWYAPGVGLVKSEMFEGKKLIERTELTSIAK